MTPESGRRETIDALLLENQQLRVALEKFHDPWKLLRRLLRIGWSRTLAGLGSAGRRVAGGADQGYEKHYGPDYKPYQVRVLRPEQRNRKRVLHAIGNFFTGGSARLVVDLVERLGDRYEQEVMARDLPTRPAYVGVKIHHYPRLTSPRPVLSLLREFRPDILHVHYFGGHRDYWEELDWKWYNQVFEAARSYGCKVIENVNIPTPPYVSEAVARYVYVSDYVRRSYGRAGDPNEVVYPGSDFAHFARRRAEVPDDCIGMVYRLDGDKVGERAIDVFIEVARRRRGTRALIVGGGYYLQVYRDAVKKAGLGDAFTFTGYVSYEDLPALYEKMSVFVAPVHRESFGQVTPFAMSMGLPVAGYRVGVLEEILGDPELLAPPGDSQRLAEIIIRLLDDRERRLRIGAANSQRARHRFSVEAMADSYDRLYDEAVGSAPPQMRGLNE